MFKSHSANAHGCELKKEINSVITVLGEDGRGVLNKTAASMIRIRKGRPNGFIM